MEKREHWNSRYIFIMAAIGSAIGLGNIWRFPYVAAQNGGGAFLVPYFVALITAGIPIMIIEYGLGVRSQASAHDALTKIKKPFQVIGWIAIFAAFAILVYYCIVLAWTCHYIVIGSLSFQSWGRSMTASSEHFMKDVLNKSNSPWQLNELRIGIFLGLIFIWLSIWLIIRGGLKQVGKVLLFTVPIPVILVIILVIRGLTLPGAVQGINYYLSPDWSKILPTMAIFKDPLNPLVWNWANVWLAAYGQIFFSLSIGFGVMIAYSSFMPKTTEVPNSAAITSFSNCAFSFLAGFAVFSILGYYAVLTNVDVSTIAASGPGLAFIVYPVALAKMPFGIIFFYILFFMTLLLLGIDSAFSLLEAVATAISDKFKIQRAYSTTLVAVIGLLLGIPFVTSAGLMWLDIIDHFIMNYVITFVAIAECIVVGWFLGTQRFTREINRHAEIPLGRIFSVIIRFVTPFILAVIFLISLITDIVKAAQGNPYEGYPPSALLIIGLGSVIIIVIVAVVFSRLKPGKAVRTK